MLVVVFQGCFRSERRVEWVVVFCTGHFCCIFAGDDFAQAIQKFGNLTILWQTHSMKMLPLPLVGLFSSVKNSIRASLPAFTGALPADFWLVCLEGAGGTTTSSFWGGLVSSKVSDAKSPVIHWVPSNVRGSLKIRWGFWAFQSVALNLLRSSGYNFDSTL